MHLGIDLIHHGAIQQRIYCKITLQTGLRELRLGRTYVDEMNTQDPWYQDECLGLTLASGLDELKGLKALEQLDVSYLNHTTAVPGLEWMVDNWLRVNRVVGMFKGCLIPKPGTHKWIKKKRRRWMAEDGEGYSEYAHSDYSDYSDYPNGSCSFDGPWVIDRNNDAGLIRWRW